MLLSPLFLSSLLSPSPPRPSPPSLVIQEKDGWRIASLPLLEAAEKVEEWSETYEDRSVYCPPIRLAGYEPQCFFSFQKGNDVRLIFHSVGDRVGKVICIYTPCEEREAPRVFFGIVEEMDNFYAGMRELSSQPRWFLAAMHMTKDGRSGKTVHTEPLFNMAPKNEIL